MERCGLSAIDDCIVSARKFEARHRLDPKPTEATRFRARGAASDVRALRAFAAAAHTGFVSIDDKGVHSLDTAVRLVDQQTITLQILDSLRLRPEVGRTSFDDRTSTLILHDVKGGLPTRIAIVPAPSN